MKVWMLPVFAALIALTVVLIPGGSTATAQEPDNFCGTENFDVPDSGANFDFTDACMAHDQCYATSGGPDGTEADRRACDQAFLDAMLESCQTFARIRICEGVAKTYFLGVRLFGWLTFYQQPI
jgi:hypothetical protein